MYKYRSDRPIGLKYKLKVKNPTWFKKGFKPWNKGVECKQFKSYKGRKAKINTIHGWVYRWFGRPVKCEKCPSKKHLEWSNKSEKYLRKRSDWQMLCKKCHNLYDYKKFGKRKIFYAK